MHTSRLRVLHLLVIVALVAGLIGAIPGSAAPALTAGSISLTALAVAYTENFDTLANTGTSSTVPTGWDFYETGTNANTLYTAGTGSGNSGDTYSFGAAASAERAFGALQSGSLIPTIGAQFTNNTTATITSLAISYTGEQWRLGAIGRADRLDFQVSTDAISLSTGTWTDFDVLDFTAPVVVSPTGALDGNGAANRTSISSTVTGLSIPTSASFWIRWVDLNATSSDDGLAVDDFSLTPSTSADNAPAVASSNPANGAIEVPINSNVTVTFSEAVNVGTGWYTLSCATSGVHTVTVSGGPTIFTLNPDADFAGAEQCTLTVVAANVTDQDVVDPPDTMAANYVASFTTTRPVTPIHAIQGAGHYSALAGQTVKAEGIVTALRTTGGTRGFYLQSAEAGYDADIATSEGIFVYTGSSSNPASLVAVGDSAQVTGQVTEFRPSATSLTLSQINSPFVITITSGNQLPAPVVLGTGGRIPPNTVIEDDATGSVETTGVFDPATDGIDFYESLEGMLVQVNNAVAAGPRSNFTSNREIAVIGDNGANAGARSWRGGVVAQASDYNPERIILNDWISGGPTLPAANVGDTFPGVTLGVIDYSFGNFKLQVISMPALVAGPAVQEVGSDPTLNELYVGAFNVENLAPTDSPTKFATLAELVVGHMRSPDVISIEEVQDNNGVTNDSVVDASVTWGMLIAAIQAAGGPVYDFRQIDPVDDQDGGAPGGNIRVGFLFRTDRGLSFIDRPGATSTTANSVVGSDAATQLQYSPGRIDPTNAAFNSSRKPLAAEFMFQGMHLFMIANHWNSKGGDEPLFGVNQPPTFTSEAQRNQQAAIVHDFVLSIVTANPNAGVLVLGDLNDFQWSTPISILKGSPAILTDLVDELSPSEQYTYVYEGNSEVLDHILASSALTALPHYYDVVHANAEFANQASDHEPQVAHFMVNGEPDFTGSPTSGQAPLAVQFAQLVPGEITDYLWTFGDGITSTLPNPTHTYTAGGSYTVTLTAFGPSGSEQVQKWDYIKVNTFADVPPTHPQWAAIETLKATGVTAGCNADGTMFCPDGLVKREEIAVFIDRSMGWPPADPVQGLFADLANDYWATPFAETLYGHGATAGCQGVGEPLKYCPLYVLSKAEIATMIRAVNGWPVSSPVGIFADVPLDAWFAPHVEAFFAHLPATACGTDAGSGKPLFCPSSQVTRAAMAEMLVDGFGL